MNDEIAKKRLGRGLAALIGEMDSPQTSQTGAVSPDGHIDISLVGPNPANPRVSFSEEELADLARSIKEHGIVQPIVVRPAKQSNHFEIIAGERRWRAAKNAGLSSIPVIIRDVDDRTSLEIAIVENVQRADLNPLEEAKGYQHLMEDHNYTQADLAKVIGKSRSHVANTLRLLKLSEKVRTLLIEGSLSAGHARTLVTANDPEGLAQRIVAEGLSVRQAEALAQRQESHISRTARPEKDADTKALEKRLTDFIGMSVTISHKNNHGELRISFKSLDQLDELVNIIGRNQ